MRRFLLALAIALAIVAPAGAWTWPADGPVIQPYSFDPDQPKAPGYHRGLDVAGQLGAVVRAPAAGLVSFTGVVPGNGKCVTIETADGWSVTLTHLGSIAVTKGASVVEGDGVGTIGPSDEPGVSDAHVHVGIRRTSDEYGYVDPAGMLPARDAAPGSTSTPDAPADPAAAIAVPAQGQTPPVQTPPVAPVPVAAPAPARRRAAELWRVGRSGVCRYAAAGLAAPGRRPALSLGRGVDRAGACRAGVRHDAHLQTDAGCHSGAACLVHSRRRRRRSRFGHPIGARRRSHPWPSASRRRHRRRGAERTKQPPLLRRSARAGSAIQSPSPRPSRRSRPRRLPAPCLPCRSRRPSTTRHQPPRPCRSPPYDPSSGATSALVRSHPRARRGRVERTESVRPSPAAAGRSVVRVSPVAVPVAARSQRGAGLARWVVAALGLLALAGLLGSAGSSVVAHASAAAPETPSYH